MSIADEITRIKDAKTNIATSIAKKGVTVPENARIDEYSALIDDVQGNLDDTTKIIIDTVIAEAQFYQGVGLEGIKTVILPNVKTIADGAFQAANEIETVDIGASVTSIGMSAFAHCTSLKTLIFRGLLEQDTALMLTATPIVSKKDGAYIYVPDTYVEQYKASTNKTLSRYTERIKRLSEFAAAAVFAGVTATVDDVHPDKKFVTSDGELVSGKMIDNKAIAEALREGETIKIPQGYHNGEGTVTAASIIKTIDATTIESRRYENGKDIKGVKILNLPNVENIGDCAFANATELQTVDIGVANIKATTAFDGCSNLTTVILRLNSYVGFDFNNTPIGNKMAGAYIYVPDEYVEDYKAHSANRQFIDQIKPLSELQSKVTLNITNVEANQFKNLKCIKEFNLPYVELIAGSAFNNSDIETLDIGSNIQELSTVSLNNMTQLSTLIIRGKPTRVTKLALINSPIWKGEGYIYVPDEYVEHFQNSVFVNTSPEPYNIVLADRVKPLSEFVGDGVDVSGVTATVDDVHPDKKFVTADGKLVSGSMPNNGAIAEVLSEGETITILKGYHNGEGTVTAAITTKTIDATEITNREYYSGKGLKGVKTLILPNVERIGSYAFESAVELKTVDIGSNCQYINTTAFNNCSNLTKLILRGLNLTNGGAILTLEGTPIGNKADGAYIYVPDEYLEQYKADSTWARHSDRFKPLSELGGETAKPVLQSLEITENGSYTPPSGVDGYNVVDVNVPIPSIKPSETITENGTYNALNDFGADAVAEITVDVEGGALQSKAPITPTKEQQVVEPDEGYYGLSGVTIEPIPDKYQDVSGVTATSEKVLDGYKFIDKSGNEITGSMTWYDTPFAELLDVKTKSYTIPEGYHDGRSMVAIETEERTIDNEAWRSAYIIEPTDGKVLSRVTVNPIPDEYQDTTGFTSVTLETTSIGEQRFADSSLKEIRLPNVTSLGTYGFSGSDIETLDLGEGVSYLPEYSLSDMSNLTKLILRGNCDIGTHGIEHVLDGTPIINGNGFIYVPDTYLDTYKSNSDWSLVASQIKPISDIEPSVLNITEVGDGQFNGLQVNALSLPDVISIGGLAFENSAIKTLIIGENLQTVDSSAYDNMPNLTKIIFKGWCPPLYASSPFVNSPIAAGDGYMYVPDELYQDYLSDAYWGSFSNMIQKISEL